MDSQSYFNQGNEKCKNKNLAGAIEDFTKAIEMCVSVKHKTITEKDSDSSVESVNVIKPNAGNVNIYFNRGCCYFYLRMYHEAIADYSKVIEYSSNGADVYFRRATANYCIKHDSEMESDLAKAEKLDAKYTRELFFSQFQS